MLSRWRMFYNDVREMIGNTPILKLNNLGIKKDVSIFAKLEFLNPGGSVKDRIGVSMLEKAEKDGTIKPGATIVEATAGNTGIGIALAALNKGYQVIFTVPEKFSVEKLTLMEALGATIIKTPKDSGMEGAVNKAKEMIAEIPNALSLLQFENDANPKVHYDHTAREIYEAMNGDIDYFVAGAGSGGTVSGVSSYLKEKNSKIITIVADPVGSTMGGGMEGCYQIEGIGNNFIPNTMDMDVVDEFIKINDEEALLYVRELARKEGLIVGTSSGAALAAAVKIAGKIEKGNIITIFPDRGDRYFSKNIFEKEII